MPGKPRPQCSLLLENRDGKILLQLRDNRKGIQYPNCFGTFGGQIEKGESKEEAIVREVEEEIEGYILKDFEYLGNYPFDGYDIHFFYKYDPGFDLRDYNVKEGQRGVFVAEEDLKKYRFAFNAKEVLEIFFREHRVKNSNRGGGRATNKISQKRGYGITFVDIDETLFHTFAKIKVLKDGKVIKDLSNQEFNSYMMGEGEILDITEFKDADLFKNTSIPILPTIRRVRRMIERIREMKSYSRIILLTARDDFPDKMTFLDTFLTHGIDIRDKNIIYIERTGGMVGTVAEKKRHVILKHLRTGIYRRCRIIDDDIGNINMLMRLADKLPAEISEKVRKRYAISPREAPIRFYALHVQPDGTLKKV